MCRMPFLPTPAGEQTNKPLIYSATVMNGTSSAVHPGVGQGQFQLKLPPPPLGLIDLGFGKTIKRRSEELQEKKKVWWWKLKLAFCTTRRPRANLLSICLPPTPSVRGSPRQY